jgi:hypothetical protein
VAAQPLSVELAAAALGQTPAAVSQEARALHACRLTHGAQPSSESGDRLEPYHDRIREALLAQLTSTEQQRCHARLARAFESEATPDWEACSRHSLGAGDRVRAARYALRAAEAAEQELAFDRAARYYELCVQLEGPEAAGAQGLTERLAAALSSAGRGTEAAERYLLAAARASERSLSLRCRSRAAEEFLRAGHSDRGMKTLELVLREVGLRCPQPSLLAILVGLWLRWKNRWLARRSGGRSVSSGRGAVGGNAELAPAGAASGLMQRVDVCAAVAFSLGYVAPIQTQYFQALHLALARRLGEPSRLCRALAAEAIYAAVGGGRPALAQRLLGEAQQLVAQVSDARARGSFAMAEGLTAFFRGDWAEARRKSAAAEQLLKSECSGVQFELDTAMLYHLSSLHFLGNLSALRSEVERRLREAEARRDLYALTILRARMVPVLHLAADEPGAVKPAVESVMWGWRPDELSIPRYWQLLSEMQAALYAGDAAAALATIQARRRDLGRSLLLRVQVTRVRLLHARAIAALGAAHAGGARQQNVRVAQRDAARLMAERAPWVRAMALGLRAGEAALQGSAALSVSLFQQAEDGLLAAGMLIDAAAARRRRGELLGGGQGAQLVAEANQVMSRQGIRNPSAFSRLLAPLARAATPEP